MNVSNDEELIQKRSFGYAFYIKRAKAKLLKGSKRLAYIDVEVKTGCVNLRFSVGAYHEVVMPLLAVWKQRVNEKSIIDKTSINKLGLS